MRWLVLAALLVVVGCGEDEGTGTTPLDEGPELVVSAAVSLTEPLTACSRDFQGAEVLLSFGGSDELAAQIRQGVTPDVYAAANTRLPEELASEGLLETPVQFATNELVLALPGDEREIERVEDLAEPGVRLVIGAESAPVGAYTRQVLEKLPPRLEAGILANVRSEEPDVRGVVGKLTQGAADAGFVYLTDITEGLTGVELPPELQPSVAYGAGVVSGSGRAGLAQRYLDGLVDGPCADALREQGFGPPPAG
jgi:molybdate transport system substrate-binding protein